MPEDRARGCGEASDFWDITHVCLHLYPINLESEVESGADALILLSPNRQTDRHTRTRAHSGEGFFPRQSDSLT